MVFCIFFAADFFNALSDNWKEKLIGISSDGASNMSGRFSGVVTRLHQVSVQGCYRVWCAAHQMDLVVQKIFLKLCNDSFMTTVMSIKSYLGIFKNKIIWTNIFWALINYNSLIMKYRNCSFKTNGRILSTFGGHSQFMLRYYD